MKEQRFELPYWISNNGDGSASLILQKSPQRAERKDELLSENGEGWGEPCNGEIELVLKDGKLYYTDIVWKKNIYETILIPIPLAGEVVDDNLSDLDEGDDE